MTFQILLTSFITFEFVITFGCCQLFHYPGLSEYSGNNQYSLQSNTGGSNTPFGRHFYYIFPSRRFPVYYQYSEYSSSTSSPGNSNGPVAISNPQTSIQIEDDNGNYEYDRSCSYYKR